MGEAWLAIIHAKFELSESPKFWRLLRLQPFSIRRAGYTPL
jgi:hypothetical protein